MNACIIYNAVCVRSSRTFFNANPINKIAMPPIIESTFNAKLSEILRSKNPRWREDNVAVGEACGGLLDARGIPDVLIAPPNALPVVVETEFMPARTVEEDAVGRLGRVVKLTNTRIEQVIALRTPLDIRNTPQTRLENAITESRFDYCLFSLTSDDGDYERWPDEGWLDGDIDSLVTLIENVGVSEQLIAESLRTLDGAVDGAAAMLYHATVNKPDVRKNIAALLHQSENEQSMRMAMAIIANALTFQELIAGAHNIANAQQLRTAQHRLPAGKTTAEWTRIIDEVNYWPVFNIAREVVHQIPPSAAADILSQLSEAVDEINANGITASHDLYGQMFQRLITDRKFLATFYTLPESAMLLAEVAADKLTIDYADENAAANLRIADFACGTGALITAAYHAVLARHRRAGHDDAAIHKTMMENALIATDIMPAGVHLTVSILSSVHPTVTFDKTKVHTLPYGATNGDISIGALDLLAKQASRDLLVSRRQLGGGGEDEIQAGEQLQAMLEMEHGSFDWVIMNPPFTRPTNHEITDRPVPSFAGFDTSDGEQKNMSDKLNMINRGLGSNRAGSGHAGLASNFIDLAHLKLKPGGVLSMVLPATFAWGSSWSKARRLVECYYDDLTVISLAVGGVNATAFSADTGIAEILLVGKKRAEPRREDDEAAVRFAALRKRPRNAAQAAVVARAIAESNNGIQLGKSYLGEVSIDTLHDGSPVGVVDCELICSAAALQQSLLVLPSMLERIDIPVARLADIAERGLVHRLINGQNPATGEFLGPFDIKPTYRPVPTYPCLWAHNADNERSFIVQPDTEGRVRKGMRKQAQDVWETAGRLHFALDFGLSANSILACITEKPTIGGRAWPNVRPHNAAHEAAIVLWMNSTLGMFLWWYNASRQQAGRASMTISRLPRLPILDTRQLTDKQHKRAEKIFARFQNKVFLQARQAHNDETRQQLDQAVLIELLGLPKTILQPLELLRHKWCCEPSVHGGKSTRPQD